MSRHGSGPTPTRSIIGISYRKVPEAIEELFGVRFSAAALIGFEVKLAAAAKPIVADIAAKLAASDGPVHADETYWTLDGDRSYFWVHGNDQLVHFEFDTTRAGEVSRGILGSDFTGTLVTDCYSGYAASVAGAKQKCLVHIARTARDWQKLSDPGSVEWDFCTEVGEFVRRSCAFYRQRLGGELTGEALALEERWLRLRLQRLILAPLAKPKSQDQDKSKALQLQGRSLRHREEWLVFVDDPSVPPSNNLAERALRPLVLLRKITFGSRSAAGASRLAVLMTIGSTAKRLGHKASGIYYEVLTRPPRRVTEGLYQSLLC